MKSLRSLTLTMATFALLVTTILPAYLAAQDLHPTRRPSPMAMARTTLDDGAYVRVVYSRPYLRGRDNIFGTKDSEALVPFGEVWRLGANEATEITVSQDVKVGGKKLPAGTYSVFAVPGEKEWSFHFNSALGLNGTFGRNAEGQFERMFTTDKDVLVTKSKPSHHGEDAEDVDQFTIAFEEVDKGAHMVVTWQKTEVRVPFTSAK